SIHRQSPPKVENANPSKRREPSMPAPFTSTDAEAEITPSRNPRKIQIDQNRSNVDAQQFLPPRCRYRDPNSADPTRT
ncbi:MAG: hypothetical protein ACK5SX_09955, partial [Sandaracinobacter sp.]